MRLCGGGSHQISDSDRRSQEVLGLLRKQIGDIGNLHLTGMCQGLAVCHLCKLMDQVARHVISLLLTIHPGRIPGIS